MPGLQQYRRSLGCSESNHGLSTSGEALQANGVVLRASQDRPRRDAAEESLQATNLTNARYVATLRLSSPRHHRLYPHSPRHGRTERGHRQPSPQPLLQHHGTAQAPSHGASCDGSPRTALQHHGAADLSPERFGSDEPAHVTLQARRRPALLPFHVGGDGSAHESAAGDALQDGRGYGGPAHATPHQKAAHHFDDVRRVRPKGGRFMEERGDPSMSFVSLICRD